MSFSRITYGSINVDFDRGLSDYRAEVERPLFENEAPLSGKIESIVMPARWKIHLRKDNASADLKNQLAAFMNNYALARSSFSFRHDRDLKGAWHFESGSLLDIDGNSPTTSTGSMAYPAGKFGLGLNITNQTVYYAASTYVADPPTKGSVSLWFSMNTASQNGTLFQIDSGAQPWAVRGYRTSGDVVELKCYNSSGSQTININTSISSLTANVFHHFVFTWDASIDNGGSIYIDGVLAVMSSNLSFTMASRGTNFRIGYDGTNYANGIFDDVVLRSDIPSAYMINEIGSGRTSIWHERNYFPTLISDDQRFIHEAIVGSPNYNIEMNFKEVL